MAAFAVVCDANGHVTVINIGSYETHGSIPSTIARLSALQAVNLQSGFLGGSLPSELGACTALTKLVIAAGGVSGTIPTVRLCLVARACTRGARVRGTSQPCL